ncbi:MAG: AAA family ATPase [Candidatus Gastranaerophilales bacterium]|nr:AAA family ATPase [Candidatus Gastranaerophilales bacterium]
MERIFVTELKIKKVRHLIDMSIPLSSEKMKHLILTGKNGSGKTSVLDAISRYLGTLVITDNLSDLPTRLKNYHDKLSQITNGVDMEFSPSRNAVKSSYENGQFILAYYEAERTFLADVPKHVEKIELQDKYTITEKPRQLFVKYLIDLKVTEALARNSGKNEKADDIKLWFDRFQELLRKIFDDNSLELIFEEEKFAFYIKEKEKELFDFNTMSSGFAAALDIVLDIIMRMEKQTNRSFDFTVPGIVLIDEIETHLHIEMQKEILKLLTTVFPNIQFIVSTHSPFILNSISNAVIYDLEKKIIVENGLSDVPYGGIVEGYFKSSELSQLLKEKFERYKELVSKQILTDDDFEEIAELEMYLSEIPDYLALNITTEYQRLKLKFEGREDI